MKIRIIQPGITEYRVALYEGLAQKFPGQIELYAGERVYTGKSYLVKGVECHYDCGGVRFGPLIWQKNLSLRGMKRGDVLVLCGDPHYFRSLYLAKLASWRGIAVVWWGHHFSATSSARMAEVRAWLAKKLSDVVLCYTKSGIDWFADRGIPRERIFAACNTVDIAPIEEALKKWTADKLAAFQSKWNIDPSQTILFCSTLRAKVKLDQLISAMPIILKEQPNVRLVVIGDGENRDFFQHVADETGVADRIIWTGKIMDQDGLAPWFLSSAVFAYPGAVGLSLLHAFGYGLPAVLHDNPAHQMPEFEAARDGENCLLFHEGDIMDLAGKILCILRDPRQREQLSTIASRTMYKEYSMEQMVGNFANCLLAARKMKLF